MARTIQITNGRVHYITDRIGGGLTTYCGRVVSGPLAKHQNWTFNAVDPVMWCWPCLDIARKHGGYPEEEK